MIVSNLIFGGIVKNLFFWILTLGFVSLYSLCQAETMDMSKDEKSMTGTAETSKGKTVTLTGTLVDVACYLDDHDAGNDHMGMKACGGAAFSKHLSLERNFRDARAGYVMAPTSDVLQEFIGRALCGMPLF